LARRVGFLDTDWYQQQAAAWAAHVQDHPDDAQAWRSLLLAAEYGRHLSIDELDDLLRRMETEVPDSWQLPYLRARRIGIGDLDTHLSLLQQAAQRCQADCGEFDEGIALTQELRSDLAPSLLD
jgi:hypothetical protein